MQRAIMEGNQFTGMTTMQMAKGLDTGDMLEVAEVEITPDDNFETIHDKLAQTVVVDMHSQMIFASDLEMQAFKARLHEYTVKKQPD